MSPAITVEAKATSPLDAQRRPQEKGESKDQKVAGKAPRVLAPNVAAITGEMSVPKVEPVREESLEEERLATPKEGPTRAREKDSTTWESPVQKKILGQDRQG